MPSDERNLRNKVLKKLKDAGFYVISISDKWRSGTPDLLVRDTLSPVATVFFIELKAEKGRLSRIQEVTFLEMIENGLPVYIVKQVEDLYSLKILTKGGIQND